MAVPFKSLDAATATGAGTMHDLEETKVDHAVKVTTTGGPSSFEVSLEVSLDGTTWSEVASISSTAYTSQGDSPARYVRARLVSFSGGSSPTFTAWIASA